MPLDFSIITQIDEKINVIKCKYQASKGLILTEADLKCLLFKKLHEIEELSEVKETQDLGIYANSIHSEVSWFDKNNKLTIKPDITILEPENLSILHGCFGYKVPLPSKQFNFHGNAIIFELKFIRYKIGISRARFEGQIKKDFNKVKKLFQRLDNEMYRDKLFCYFVIFNKTNRTCQEFEKFFEQNKQTRRHKIIYCSGDVEF